MYIIGQHGLGDGIYLRAFLPRDCEVYLRTPWPELYSDMENIKPCRLGSPLRTQAKNERGSGYQWHTMPVNVQWRRASYGGQNIFKGLQQTIGRQPAAMSLPDYGARPIAGKYAVIRPATLRREYMAPGRNPNPEYIAMAARALIAAGFEVVSIADIDEINEMAHGDLPPSTVTYNAGQLSVSEVLRYTQHADAIIGGIGWIVPAAIAQHRPALIICGGAGGITGPDIITDKRMDLTNITFLMPDNYCQCRSFKHDCDKAISNAEQRINDWVVNLV